MAQQTLYNRYRPTRFSDMIGQEAMLRALRNQVMSGRIGHAYLFSGPRGTGKTTLARIFARAMNCENPQDGEPCGVCPSCQALASERAMDIVEIDAASNNGVDDIRELRENVGYLPASGRYRVYIIDEVHMLSNAAFNALLKTLEEPPAHAVFILATTEVRKLLPTVLSRCQRYEFQRYSASQIASYLGTILKDLGIEVEDRGLVAIARAADGCMRDALTMLEQCLPLADENKKIAASGVYAMLGTTDRRYYFSLSEAVLSGDAGRALAGVQMMVEMGCDPVTLAADLQRHFRDLLMVSYGQGEALGTDEQTLKQLLRQAAMATPEQLLFALGLYTKLENEMRYAAMPRTYLELAVARSCTLREENLQALMARVEKLERQIAEGVRPAQAVSAAQAKPEPVKAQPEPPAPKPAAPVTKPAPQPAEDDTPPWEEPSQAAAKPAGPVKPVENPAPAVPTPPEPDYVAPEEEPPWDEGGFSGIDEPEFFEEPERPAPKAETPRTAVQGNGATGKTEPVQNNGENEQPQNAVTLHVQNNGESEQPQDSVTLKVQNNGENEEPQDSVTLKQNSGTNEQPQDNVTLKQNSGEQEQPENSVTLKQNSGEQEQPENSVTLKIWREAREKVKSPMVAAYMSQGRAKSLDGNTLTVSFPPQQASARMALERERNQAIVGEALAAVAGRAIQLRLIEEELTERQQAFLRRNLAKLPADRVELNFEDQD